MAESNRATMPDSTQNESEEVVADKRRAAGSEYWYHPEEEVERTFRRHGLAVKSVVPVLRTTAYRKRQARSIVLYVLERAEAAA